MSSEELSFLNEEEEAEVVAEPQVEEPPQEAEPQPDPEPEAAQPPAEPVAEPEPEPNEPPVQAVPLATFLQMRDRSQDAERQLQEVQRKLASMQQAQEAPKAPDFFEDPEAAFDHRQGVASEATWRRELNRSKYRVGRQMNDPELMEKAEGAFLQAMQSNPSLGVELRRHPEPYDLVVDWYKGQTFMQEVGRDPDAWKAQQLEALKAQALEQAKAELSAQFSQPAAPPPSIGRATSAASPTVEVQPTTGLSELWED